MCVCVCVCVCVHMHVCVCMAPLVPMALRAHTVLYVPSIYYMYTTDVPGMYIHVHVHMYVHRVVCTRAHNSLMFFYCRPLQGPGT